MNPPIKHVYLDIGNVLLALENDGPGPYLKDLIDLNPKDWLKHVTEDPLFKGYETGSITPEAFFVGLKEQFNYAGPVEELVDAGNRILKPIQTNLAYARSVHQHFAITELTHGQTLGLFSNTNEAHRQYFEALPGAQWLPEVGNLRIYSHEVKCRKPSPEIYKVGLRRANAVRADRGMEAIAPENIYFLDDLEENVLAAREAGWQADVFAPQSCLETALAPELAP